MAKHPFSQRLKGITLKLFYDSYVSQTQTQCKNQFFWPPQEASCGIETSFGMKMEIIWVPFSSAIVTASKVSFLIMARIVTQSSNPIFLISSLSMMDEMLLQRYFLLELQPNLPNHLTPQLEHQGLMKKFGLENCSA